MSGARLLAAYLWSRKVRTGSTVIAVAAVVFLFVLLRTVVGMWESGAQHAAQDRLYTRHKISFALKIPRRYADDVAAIPGVRAATWAVWMGLRDPRRPSSNFASYAVDAATVFDVYDELSISPPERQAWREDRQGVVLGDALAQRMGVTVGDRISLEGTLYPGTWQFRVAGIYHPQRRSFDAMSLMMHWTYLDDMRRPVQRGEVGWVTGRVDDASRSGAVAQAIDAHFAERDVKTSTVNERTANQVFLSFMTAIVAAVNGITLILLIIAALVLGNAVAIGTRECTRDYATLRALGFSGAWVGRHVSVHALILAVTATALGTAGAGPLIDGGLRRFVEANMTTLFPSFHLEWAVILQAAGLVCLGALVAAYLPARRVARMSVVNALRSVA